METRQIAEGSVDNFDQILTQELRCIPIATRSLEDIYLVGFPKSGNTWIQNLVCSAVFGTHSFYTPDSVVQQLVPDVHTTKFYRRFREPSIFKTHDLPRPEYQRVVYILRDGRDAMVSYQHHLSALYGRTVDLGGMLQFGSGLFPCRWYQHVEIWLSNPFGATMLIVKYEDLKANAAKILAQICSFIGVERPKEFLSEIAANAEFEKMQQRERQQGWDNEQWPKDAAFVRRGTIGGYRDEMPPDLQELFLQQARSTLLKCGYAV